MKLTGLEFTASMRMTQAGDALDVDMDLLSTTTTIDQVFYSTLFFDMLNGDVTGAAGGSSVPGFVIKAYDTDDVLFTTSGVVQLDWYEVETGYISEALTTKIASVASDVRLRKIELYYIANEGGADKEVLITTSEEIAKTAFADADSNGVYGVLVENANGAVTMTTTMRFVIAA